MLRIIALLAILMVAGCASVPMADQAHDAQAKQFIAPPGKAAIYLFRDESFGGLYSVTVGLDGRIAGQTAAQTFFVWHVDPGPHQVSSHAENLVVANIDAEAGRVYFVWQEMGNGLNGPRTYLHVVDEDRGRTGVNASRLATPLLY